MLPRPMDELPRRDPADVVLELIAPAGQRVLDIGCGDGSWMRRMADWGATVTGLEVTAEAAAGAREAGAGPVEVGRAEALPFENARFDVAVFMKSLHHVPPAEQPRALDEAARVLAPGGLIVVVEPIATGPFQELMQSVDDETDVRASARAAIGAMCARGGAEQRAETWFVAPRILPSFDAMKHGWHADPARCATIARQEDELRARFHALGRKTDRGWEFDQAFRVNLLAPRVPAPAA